MGKSLLIVGSSSPNIAVGGKIEKPEEFGCLVNFVLCLRIISAILSILMAGDTLKKVLMPSE